MVINREGESPEENLDSLEVFPKKLEEGYPFLWIINPTNKKAIVKVIPPTKGVTLFPKTAKIPPGDILRMNVVYLLSNEAPLDDETMLVLETKTKKKHHILIPVTGKSTESKGE